MLPSVMPKGNLLAWLPAGIRRLVTRRPTRPAPPAPGVPLMRPNLAQLARPDVQLPAFVAECAVARKYLDLLGPLDWNHFPERPSDHPWPGKTPAARAPYLVKINEGQRYMSKLMQMPSVPVTQNDPLRQGAESDQMISK